MRYKPRGIAALRVALGDLPDTMPAEADQDLGVSARTLGEPRKVAAWPENLLIPPPREHRPGNAIKVSRAGRATRLSPKP